MKTSLTTLAMMFAISSIIAQNATAPRPTVAVANPSTQGFEISSEVTAKMIRFELHKINIYQVYDEFDMAEALKDVTDYNTNCYGVLCLSELGAKLKVDYVFSGTFDKLADRIVINLKVIDVKNQSVHTSMMREFTREEENLQRMIESMLSEMYQIPFDQAVLSSLKFKNAPIVQEEFGRINNTGPRMGVAYMLGDLNEFATRPAGQGGLDIAPVVSMIGYQVEWQYVGTERFSALVEGIFNISGMEQGRFMPSILVLNGFRFGTAGWEFGFGPGFGFKSTSQGFFDTENAFGNGKDYYFSSNTWGEYCAANFGEYYEPEQVAPYYSFTENFDKNGDTELTTHWVFAAGRTFRAGSLNIPVNAFYSLMDGGGYAGLSFGFNVIKK
jgi:hypothetical protein